MSNNYYAFSTAPGTHAPGVPVTSMLGHPSGGVTNNINNKSNGMLDGMVPQLGPGSPSTLMSGGGGGGGAQMAPYPLPPSQQQPHTANMNRLNPGATMFPSPLHATPVTPSTGLVNNSNNNNNNGAASVGGPAVPAPRSAATLLAEATGAPPPPPPPSRASLTGNSLPGMAPGPVLGGGSTALAGSFNSPSLHVTTPPVSVAGISTPMSGPAGAGGAGAPLSPTTKDPSAPFAAPLVSTSFNPFTTSAAAILSSQGLSALGSEGNAAATTATNTTAAAAAALSPHSRVEVQITLSSRPPPDAGVAENGTVLWDPTKEPFKPEEEVAFLLCAFLPGDDDTEEPRMDLEEELELAAYTRYTVFADNDLRKSAAKLLSLLAKASGNTQETRMLLRELTRAIVLGSFYRVVLLLPVQHAVTLRFSLVQFLLSHLVRGHRSIACADQIAKGLVAMMQCDLLSTASYAAMVHTFLQRPEMAAMALRLMAFGLEGSNAKHDLGAALSALPGTAKRLQEIYTQDRKHEVEVALLSRAWARREPILYGTMPLDTSSEGVRGPVTCMSYFAVRDELISGHMNGSVVLWGAPQMVRETSQRNPLGAPRPAIRPRGVVPLPLDCVPVAMAGQRIDGQYLAIASMPYKARAPYASYCKPAPKAETAPGSAAEAEAAGASAAPRRDAAKGAGDGAIIVITCSEHSIRWNKGEVIMRPAGVALTAITALRNSIVVVGESMVSPDPQPTCYAELAAAAVVATPASSAHHRLSFVDVACGSVMRQIPKAHDDYITTLTVLEESSYVLLSGGRDAAIKLWDPRLRDENPVVNTALCTDAAKHGTTISGICTTGYNIVSTDVDGATLVWDLRSMEAPLVRHDLGSPIVDVALIPDRRVVVATSRGLITMPLDTLDVLDMYYAENGYSHVLPNNTGELIFAASCSGSLSAVLALGS